MYKKRIRAWKLTKNMKAFEKEELINDCLSKGAPLDELDGGTSVRTVQVLRHVRQLKRKGTIHDKHANHSRFGYKHATDIESCNRPWVVNLLAYEKQHYGKRHLEVQHNPVNRPIALPDDLENVDLLLRIW